jgi:hypothetical protein
MGETFKLNFISNGEGEVVIDEPIGFDKADFNLEQRSKGYGRDISFSGGESNFEFYRMRNHYYDTLMYYYETFGWESEVQLIIEVEGISNIIGDLDFKEADTNQLEYFKCKVIQQSNQAIVKRRRELNVDVFSSENIDGDAIVPLATENVLVKAKPIKQTSNWETPSITSYYLYAERAVSNTIYYVFNPSQNLVKSEIDDSLTFFSNLEGFTQNADNFKIIEAQNNLRNIVIDITNFDLSMTTDVDNGGDGYIDLKLELRYGADYATATVHTFFTRQVSDTDPTYTNTNDYNFTIPLLNRGDGVWLYFWAKVRQSANPVFGNPRFEAFPVFNSMDVQAVGTSISYNTIVPSIRIYDGVSQVVESISGLETSFPFTEVNGEMYNQRIFNGNLLRNITDRPFNISLKNIEDWLPEINADYEVGSEVFFGKYEDFYTNNEIGVFTSVRFDDYKKSFNERYAINEFYFKYKKFQSQKENEVENTFDVVHGESQWSILNRFVENKKEATVAFVRDSFYIDEQRRKALDLNETTSTQDDETIFILDTKESTADLVYEETDFLQHTYDATTGYLKLSNTGSFSFILIGVTVGEIFVILGGDANAGTYTVIEVAERYIELSSGSGTINNNGERITGFRYIVSTTTAPYVSWSDEGFNYITNILAKDNYANLKYTIKRNIRRFYNPYLATSNLFTNKAIKRTLYQNNADLSLSYEGYQTVEGDDFTPTNPILSPYKHEITLITDFLTYKALEDATRTTRGYIRTYDAKGHVIKVYPEKMTYVNSAELGELKIVGEERYVRSIINITYANTGFITINDEYRTPKIKYSINEELFSIFDEQYRLLYDPVFWHKISVNNAIATSKTQLIQWLSLIS